MDNKIFKTVKYIVELIVNGDYLKVDEYTKGIRLNSNQIKKAIEDYPGVVVLPPNEAYSHLDIIEIDNYNPKQWYVSFDLWTREFGKSDNTLEMTLIENDKELMDVELYSIHVL